MKAKWKFENIEENQLFSFKKVIRIIRYNHNEILLGTNDPCHSASYLEIKAITGFDAHGIAVEWIAV